MGKQPKRVFNCGLRPTPPKMRAKNTDSRSKADLARIITSNLRARIVGN